VTRLGRGKAPAVAVFDNYWATTLAFARSLGRQGVPLHFFGSGAGRWSRYRTRHMRCPAVENADEFLPWLRDQVRSGAITRIAPTTDLIAYYTAVLRHEFAPEVQRTIAPLTEIETCLIKSRFSAAAALPGESELPTLSAEGLDQAMKAAARIGFPLMLKPNSHLVVGFAERGSLVLDQADLARHFKPYDVAPGQESLAWLYPELRWPILQRYLPSARQRVYSVSGIKDADGGVLSACVSYKSEQWPPHVGVSTVQVGCDDAHILERGLQIVNRILSRGIFEIELLADGGELHPIDLNPRAFGFISLDMARGSDLPWLWYRATLEPLRPSRTGLHPGAMVARSSMFYFLKPLFGQRNCSVSMFGDWRDPLPMLISRIRMLRHPRAALRALLRTQLATSRG
jgi:predicted ATP-grasp superfamily ATP-dependent carboligase